MAATSRQIASAPSELPFEPAENRDHHDRRGLGDVDPQLSRQRHVVAVALHELAELLRVRRRGEYREEPAGEASGKRARQIDMAAVVAGQKPCLNRGAAVPEEAEKRIVVAVEYGYRRSVSHPGPFHEIGEARTAAAPEPRPFGLCQVVDPQRTEQLRRMVRATPGSVSSFSMSCTIASI